MRDDLPSRRSVSLLIGASHDGTVWSLCLPRPRAALIPRRVVSRNVKSRPDGIRLAPSTLNHTQTDLNGQFGGGFSTNAAAQPDAWQQPARW
ncbi:LOW QUALITY PROTEIN: hypothetical protein OPAG_03989, partial [Rhodococcus opacus PD630]